MRWGQFQPVPGGLETGPIEGCRVYVENAGSETSQKPIMPEPPWLNGRRYFRVPVGEKAYR
jgi:hypothetical protein